MEETKEEGNVSEIIVPETSKPHHSLQTIDTSESDSLISIAVKRNDPIDKIQQLMDLRDREYNFKAKQAFVLAMSMFKSESIKIVKNKKADFSLKTGGRASYRYATLDNILETVLPLMSKYGLSHSWKTEQDKDEITVTCILTHSLGHSESVTLKGAPDTTGAKNAIQAVGSTTKYLQRYTFLSVAGLSDGDDTDGNIPTGKTLPEEQKKEFIARIAKCSTIEELDKIGVEAAVACDKYNDLHSNNEIKKEFVKIKDLIENPPE